MAKQRRKPSKRKPDGADITREEELFFQEVDEELKQERAQELWKKYGSWFVGAVLAVVAGIGGWQYWQSEQAEALAQASQAFHVASALSRQDEVVQATEAFDRLAGQDAGGYSVLSRLRAAALLARSNDLDAALAHYRAVADNGDANLGFRRFATVMWAMHGIDKLDAENVLPRLEPLMSENAAWRHSAREMAAVYKNRSGERSEALSLFEDLAADEEAPETIRLRAREMVEILGGPGGSGE